jgi:hypothetical protein
MCRALCGYENEPANQEERKWWRWRHYQNHGFYPLTSKQEKEGKKPTTKKSKPTSTEPPKIVYRETKTDKWGGELPEEEPNDSGWGTRMVYPQAKCPHCPAAFHDPGSLPNHIKDRHPEQDGGEGSEGVPA